MNITAQSFLQQWEIRWCRFSSATHWFCSISLTSFIILQEASLEENLHLRGIVFPTVLTKITHLISLCLKGLSWAWITNLQMFLVEQGPWMSSIQWPHPHRIKSFDTLPVHHFFHAPFRQATMSLNGLFCEKETDYSISFTSNQYRSETVPGKLCTSYRLWKYSHRISPGQITWPPALSFNLFVLLQGTPAPCTISNQRNSNLQ